MSIEIELLILKRLGLFRCLPDDQLRLVVFGAERMLLQEGHELFREHQPADCAFVLLGGQIDLYHQIWERRVMVRSVVAGEMIGEFALIGKTKRPVSAIVTKKCEVLRISHNNFRRILNEYPQSIKLLYQYLRDNFHEMTERLHNYYLSCLD